MSGIDYEELIRSPLDDLDQDQEGTGWAGVVGLVVGVGFGLFLATVLGGSPNEPVTSVVAETTSPAPIVEVVSPDYPEGFVELVPGLGATVSEIVRTDEVIAVTFLLAAARGEDVLSRTWPAGGTWSLESTSGTVVQSTRVAVARFSPAAFTVEFPAEPFAGQRTFATVNVIELWNQVTVSGTVEQSYSTEDWVSEPVSVPISSGSTLLIPSVELSRFLGFVEWRLEGPEPGGIVNVSAQLLDSDGVEIGAFASFPSNIRPALSGATGLNWNQPFSVDQRPATSVVLEYTVTTVDIEAAEASFDVSSVPTG